MRPILSAVLATTILVSTITPAVAGGPPGSVEPTLADPPPITTTKRYGTQIFLTDLAVLAAVGLVSQAEASSSDGGSGIGGLVSLGYFAAAPLMHVHYGNPSGARKSIAARALMPVGGALVGMALVGASRNNDPNEEDDFGNGFDVIIGMALGATAGALSAMVLDWTVFAKKTVEVKPSGYAVAPNVGVTRQSVSVGLAGRF